MIIGTQLSETINLNNCPFCGGYDLSADEFKICDIGFKIKCDSCKAEGPQFKSLQLATEGWNKAIKKEGE